MPIFSASCLSLSFEQPLRSFVRPGQYPLRYLEAGDILLWEHAFQKQNKHLLIVEQNDIKKGILHYAHCSKFFGPHRSALASENPEYPLLHFKRAGSRTGKSADESWFFKESKRHGINKIGSLEGIYRLIR